MTRLSFVGLAVLATIVGGAAVHGESSAWDEAEALLIEGRVADAQKSLEAAVAKDADDDDARFGLGLVQTLSALEEMMQGLYRYGLDPTWTSNLPFVRLPVPTNPKPEPLTNEAFRKLIAEFASDMATVQKTLAGVKGDDVKVLVRPGMYRLDFDGDGKGTKEESLWTVFARTTGAGPVPPEAAEGFVIAMDKGDAHWLSGYTHLLAALCEMYLAHDTQNLHDHAAQFFFPAAEVEFPFNPPQRPGDWMSAAFDGVAFIHLLNLPVAEPKRMETAHGHLLAMVDESRANFAAIDAETDDDREWIPSPKQKNVAIPEARVSPEMVAGWHEVLDEWERILKGEKLIPFWRGGSQGVNLKRVFTEPTTFDLVLWVQGSAAAPYLEDGDVTSGEFWREIQRGFRGQFFWFAVWVN